MDPGNEARIFAWSLTFPPLFFSFFEWDRKGRGHKQPYFIYFSDNSPTEETMELVASERDGVYINLLMGLGTFCSCLGFVPRCHIWEVDFESSAPASFK